MARRKGGASTAPGLNRFYAILAVVAVAGVAALAWGVVGSRGGAATAPVQVEGLDDPQQLVALAQGVAVGEESAPVKVLEFGDYECPACGVFASQVKPLLERDYVGTGKVRFVFYDFPLAGHRNSFLAARAVRCAGDQGRFWEYHAVVYGRQSDWAGREGAVETFVDFAGQVGLDVPAFEGCLESDRYADVVTANYRLGEQLGVNATPTVIVNGRRARNPLDYQELKGLIDRELGQ